MDKTSKKIYRVNTGTGEYYCYSLGDIFGKRKFLYASTKSELIQKIEQAKREKKELLQSSLHKSKKLSAYIEYYLQRAAKGNSSASNLEQMKTMYETTIRNKELDKDIDTITTQDIVDFYDKLSEAYAYSNIYKTNFLLKKVFRLASENEIAIKVDFSLVTIPKKTAAKNNPTTVSILAPEEFDRLLNFCLKDDCTRYGKNERIITAGLFTGLLFSVLSELRYKDVDTERGVLVLEDREYILSDAANKWFKRQYEKDKKDITPFNEDGFFFAIGDDTPPPKANISKSLIAITTRCGLPKGVNSQVLRRSYVISELVKGTTKDTLRKNLGYSSNRQIIKIQTEYEFDKNTTLTIEGK